MHNGVGLPIKLSCAALVLDIERMEVEVLEVEEADGKAGTGDEDDGMIMILDVVCLTTEQYGSLFCCEDNEDETGISS